MASGIDDLPMPILTDSYKASHFQTYPEAMEMKAYGEFRHGYDKDASDTRVLFYGMRYIVEKYLSRQWTVEEVERASTFFSSHQAPDNSAFQFPKGLFLDFIREHQGYFPIKLQALKEGSVVHARIPVYQISASGKYAPLITYLETLLTMVWYPTTVATLSRRARDVIEAAFEESADQGKDNPLVGSRLHDFGMRGCTGVEQTVLGGVAHLLNFSGSDTMSAGFHAQFHLNEGRPVASSAPATEHSSMTAWGTEREAFLNLIEHYGEGIYSCVMDSYDYAKALSEVLPSVAQAKLGKGGHLVVRPDSGDPVEAVVMALEALETVFGVDTNTKGFKVPKNCSVIYGDGVSLSTMKKILAAMMEKGFSAETVAFGMGSGLLHKLNRDTLSFATKLNYIRHTDGLEHDVMKNPVAGGKASLPGALAVKLLDSVPTVFPQKSGLVSSSEDLLQTIYDHGPVKVQWESFDVMKDRIRREWQDQPRSANVISKELADKISSTVERLKS